jgi:hypothetical protein
VLPDAVKTELSVARSQFEFECAAMALEWAVFVVGSGVWRVVAAAARAALSMALAYRWLVQAAQVYGELLESAFDLISVYAVRDPALAVAAKPGRGASFRAAD